jgi:L-lactate dehydrogenase complex protein LldE
MTAVSLFATCIVDTIYPNVGEAVVEVLERQGTTVRFPPGQTCCGLPFYNNGYHEQARRQAEHTIEAMAGDEPIVVPSGSCAWMMRKVYPELVPGAASSFSARVFEFSELLVERMGGVKGLCAEGARVTYHPSCHLLRGLRVIRPPLRLLESIDGLEVAPLERDDECCGFGGTFAVRQPGVSSSMLEDKLRNTAATGAQTLVVTDPGCLLQLDGGARHAGCPFSVRHLAEVIADALPKE